jgi:predicted nucleotidyltransferase
MSQREPAVYKDGRYNGRTLQEWVPDLVSRLVERFDPLKIVLFGSLATGDGGPDSDIDLVVVVPKVDNKHRLAVDMRLALADVPVPNDVIPTDPEEIRQRGDTLGGVLRAALREGQVIYERS